MNLSVDHLSGTQPAKLLNAILNAVNSFSKQFFLQAHNPIHWCNSGVYLLTLDLGCLWSSVYKWFWKSKIAIRDILLPSELVTPNKRTKGAQKCGNVLLWRLKMHEEPLKCLPNPKCTLNIEALRVSWLLLRYIFYHSPGNVLHVAESGRWMESLWRNSKGWCERGHQ